MGRTSAGRTGPCCHCGIDSTPLWRQGPPAKPVLCNACGSRFRLKGTLDNYFPKNMSNRNLRAGPDLSTPNKDSNDGIPGTSNKLTLGSSSSAGGRDLNMLNKDSSEGTSTGTRCKLTSSCAGIDPKSSGDIPIPSREGSQMGHKEMTPMEAFHSQLLDVQKSEEQPLNESEDDVLIYDKWNFIPSNEIGLGCMLLDPADLTPSSSEKKSPKQA